jgi:feruloyl esterase
MTVAAKQIVQAFYGKTPRFSYYEGCSTGGQQGLVEAQRFPDDFDAVIAGAPANNRTRLHMGFVWDVAVTAKPGSYIPEAKLSLMYDRMLAACTAEKASPEDRFLTNPQACHWDAKAIECMAGDAPDCLTADQVTVAQKLYGGPINPVTHAAIYPGFARGSELEWDVMIPEGGPPRFDALFKWTFGADWNWRTFDFNRDVTAVDALLSAKVNATDPNLEVFKAHGHKLIVYHGWADTIVPSLESINYYTSVQDTLARSDAGKAASTGDFYRLFMVPGMAHCVGGPGLNSLDAMEALEGWVEQGVAPEKIVAKRTEKGVTSMTRPACSYPQVAHYKGSGDANDAANFTCEKPAEE